MYKVKNALYSEKGMTIVNALFFLSAFFRNMGVIFVAYTVWIFYLINCIQKTPSKITKLIYAVLVAYAGVVIVLNLYFLVNSL